MNTAIIVAAGSGTRIDSTRPKQFLEILGKPIIIHAMERFEACPDVHAIVVVLAASEIQAFQQGIARHNIEKLSAIVEGGETRAESVFKGFQAADPSAKIVAVHDGARPLVTSEEISKTIKKAFETGAACLVAPVTDTIKRVYEGNMLRTVDRNHLRRALTPQAFRYEILQRALANAELGESVTDECYLVEKMGVDIAIVEGSPRNIKITHIDDLILAETFLTKI